MEQSVRSSSPSPTDDMSEKDKRIGVFAIAKKPRI